ncbi:MAG: ATP-binding protein [Alphaproteobacteria bacterium]
MLQKIKTSFKSFYFLSFQKLRLGEQIPLTLILVGLFFGLLTIGVLAGFSVLNMQPRYLLVLLALDVIVLLSLGVVIAKKIVKIWVDRQRGLAGSKIHVRITALFALVSIIPAITMTIFAILFFHYGLQDWFSGRIKSALSESVAVSNSYLAEHRTIVAKDATLMAYDLNKELPELVKNRANFDQYLTMMASIRSLTEAIVFDRDQKLLGRSHLSFALQFEPLPSRALQEAQSGKVALLNSQAHDRVRALIELPGRPGVYLFVGRSVDPQVLQHLKKSEEIFKEYGVLEGQRTGFELLIMALFAVVALLLLLAAIWTGISLASRLIAPIRHLIDAAEKMRVGHLNIRVPESPKDHEDEMNVLSRSFNRMAFKIQQQQQDLMKTNRELETQKQFIESTLAGVSVGVIGLDEKGKILYPNQLASSLLDIDLSKKIGQKLLSVFPPLAHVLETPLKTKIPFFEQQATFQIRGVSHAFLIRVLSETDEKGSIQGYVVTLDEITHLLDAQKKAAWSDVARRVAHEIKNPLTPIHLSAERMRRRYLKEIKTSPETFIECIDTIIRQVAYIGNMVSEFSSFARMPLALMQNQDLSVIVNQVVSLQKNVKPDLLDFTVKLPHEPVMVTCDEQQVSQALLNVVKNSMESILENPDRNEKGQINMSLSLSKTTVTISIEDNGPGFPKDLQDNLMDPYVTTRPKGTGLGLSIVKRIMEDHKGKLVLENKDKGTGARVSLVFPRVENV